jgi:hypothetical protein
MFAISNFQVLSAGNVQIVRASDVLFQLATSFLVFRCVLAANGLNLCFEQHFILSTMALENLLLLPWGQPVATPPLLRQLFIFPRAEN